MRKAIGAVVSGFALVTFYATCGAQQLPKSGSITFHTGWKDVGTAIEVAAKRMQGQGLITGATFNDKGSGPLHLGPANCSYAFMAIAGSGKNTGFCTFSDADGDKVFTAFTGTITPDGQGNGTNDIVGGTGKYDGIKGNGPWKCKYVGSNGELTCAQTLEYRLP
jgi:hypothetical protein